MQLSFKKTILSGLLGVSLGLQWPACAMAATNLGTVTDLTTFSASPTTGAFDDLYNFAVGVNAGAIITGTAFTFGTGGTTLTNLALYVGTYATVLDLVGQTPLPTTIVKSNSTGVIFTAYTTLADYSYASLAASGYTLRVTGTDRSWTLPYTGFIALAPVPEPETYALVLAGLGMMGSIIRRRKINQ